MAFQKAVWVKDDDAELWRRAERHAKSRRMSMSGLVLNALDEYLRRHEDEDDNE